MEDTRGSVDYDPRVQQRAAEFRNMQFWLSQVGHLRCARGPRSFRRFGRRGQVVHVASCMVRDQVLHLVGNYLKNLDQGRVSPSFEQAIYTALGQYRHLVAIEGDR